MTPVVLESAIYRLSVDPEHGGKENASRAELLQGKSLREVYRKYGVL